MIYRWEQPSSVPQEAVLAHMIMSDDESTKETIKQDWDPGSKGDHKDALFKPEELDIYVNKVTLEAFIFHGKEVDYDSLERLEYSPGDYTVDVVKKDGTRIDLGVKIQWLVRPYFSKAEEISIVRTKDGESIDGKVIPVVHKQKKEDT